MAISDQEISSSLENVLDLSLTDIYIMQNLILLPGPIPRTLFLEYVNSCCTDQGVKEIPTSSFYHRLEKLHQRGFITIIGKGKAQKIQENDLTREVLRSVNNLAMSGLYQTDLNNQSQETTPQLIAKLNLTKQFESALMVNAQDMMNVPTFSMIGDLTKKLYILANDDYFERFQKLSEIGFPSEISQTRYVEGKIREADDFFETTLIINYNKTENYLEYPLSYWLQEAYRVTKPGGLMVVHAISELPESNHVLLNCILKDVKQSFITKVINEDQLVSDLSQTGLNNIQSTNHNGILLAWGTK
jgi:hypothetical protein